MVEQKETKTPLTETIPPSWRLPLSVLLVGGLLLILMGQAVAGRLVPESRWPIYLLMGIGALSFGLGGRLMMRPRLPEALLAFVRPVWRYFSITGGQLLLLLFAPTFALMAALAGGDRLEAHHFLVSLFAWLLAMTAVLGGGFRRQAPEAEESGERELLGIIVLFFFALWLRALTLGELPPTLSGDEGSAGLMAVRFFKGEVNNIFTVGWFSFPSLYFAVQSLGIALLGQTVEGLRITSAVGGALTVVGLYWLARSMFGRLTALLAALFLLTFHYHIHFSRIGLNNIWDGFFLVMVWAGLWYGWQTGRRFGFLVCGLALGLGQYFYVSIRVAPLLLLLWGAGAFLTARPTFRRRLPDLILAAWVAVVVVLPLGIFFSGHPQEFYAPMQRVTILEGWLEHEAQLQGQAPEAIVWDQMVATAAGFTHRPLRLLYDPGAPLLLALPAALFLLGLLLSASRFDLRHLLLLLPLLAVIVLGAFSQDAPASQRYIIAAPLVAIFVAIPLAQVVEWLGRLWPRLQKGIVLAAVLLMLVINAGDLRYYFFDVYDEYVLGGFNTEVANAVADFLAEQSDPPPDVYFFGFPRMGYFSLSTIPYLVPEVNAQDVINPLTAPPGWILSGPTLFIFLPERIDELRYVRLAYPGGTYNELRHEGGSYLFMSYAVR